MVTRAWLELVDCPMWGNLGGVVGGKLGSTCNSARSWVVSGVRGVMSGIGGVISCVGRVVSGLKGVIYRMGGVMFEL